MRLIHDVHFSPQEFEFYRQLVFSNIMHGMKQLLEALDDMDLQVSDDVEEYAALVDEPPDVKDGQPFPMEYHEPLKKLWLDPIVQKGWSRGNEAALPDKYARSALTSSFSGSLSNLAQFIIFFCQPRPCLR